MIYNLTQLRVTISEVQQRSSGTLREKPSLQLETKTMICGRGFANTVLTLFPVSADEETNKNILCFPPTNLLLSTEIHSGREFCVSQSPAH